MARDKCSYIFCERTTRKTPGIRTFTFPVKDQVRCKQWIINSGNVDLFKLSPDKLKRCFICEKHFRNEYFLSKRLAISAVPIMYKVRSGASKTYGRKEVSKDIDDNPAPSTSTALDAISSITEEIPLLKSQNKFVTELTNLPAPERKQLDSLEKRNLKRKLAKTEKELERLRSKLKKHIREYCLSIKRSKVATRIS